MSNFILRSVSKGVFLKFISCYAVIIIIVVTIYPIRLTSGKPTIRGVKPTIKPSLNLNQKPTKIDYLCQIWKEPKTFIL